MPENPATPNEANFLILRLTIPGGSFTLSESAIIDIKNPEESPAAMDLVNRAWKSSPEDPLYVAAVGAITNVSNAILIDPAIINHHWPHQREFNFRQDLKASRIIFDCGVPFVQLACR